MKPTKKNRFSLLTQAALASTLFYVLSPAFAVPVILTDAANGKTSADVGFAPGGGYDYQNIVNDVSFTIVEAANNVGNTAGVSVDKTIGGKAANLLFAGNGNVTGTVGPTNKLTSIDLQGGAGKVVTFAADVNVNTITISGAGGTGDFDGNINGDVIFTQDGTLSLADGKNLTGGIDASTNNFGTVILEGGHTISGSLGATSFLKFLEVNTINPNRTVTLTGDEVNVGQIDIFDAGGAPTTLLLNNANMVLETKTGMTTATPNNNILDIERANTLTSNLGTLLSPFLNVKVAKNGDTIINGNVFSKTVEFQGNNNLTIGSGFNITGNVTTLANNSGKLVLSGNNIVDGSVGAAGLALNTVTAGGAGQTVTITKTVDAATINVVDTTTVNFNDKVTGNLNFTKDGIVNLANNKQIIGNVDNASGTDFTGTFNFVGSSVAGGNFGATRPLKLIQVNSGGVGGQTVTLTGAVINSQNININDNGILPTSLVLDNPVMTLTSNITAKTPNLDVLDIKNATLLKGNIGTNLVGLNLIKVAQNVNTTINGDFFATQAQFQGDNTLFLDNDSGQFTLFTPLTTTANNQGTATFLTNSDIKAQIGDAVNALKAVNFNGVDSVNSLENDIFATNVNLNNGLLSAVGLRTINGNLNINNGTILSLEPTNFPLNVTNTFNLNGVSLLNIDFAGQLAKTGFVKAPIANLSPNAGVSTSNLPTIIPDGSYSYIIVDGGPGSTLNELPVGGDSLLLNFRTEVDAANNDLLLKIDAFPVVTFANQSNTVGIAGALDVIDNNVPPPSGNLLLILQQLRNFQDSATLNRDLAALAPIVDGAVFYESMSVQQVAFNAVEERLRNRKGPRPLNIHDPNIVSGFSSGDPYCYNNYYNGRGTWGKVFARAANQQERQGVEGYRNHMFGFSLGIDTMMGENALLGGAFSFADLEIDHHVSDSETRVYSYQVGLYGEYDWCPQLYSNWELLFAYNDYDTQRNFQFGNVFFSPNADYNGYMFGGKTETGWDYVYSDLHIIPLATLFYSHLDLSSYTERGMGNANQFVESTEFDLFRGGLGVRLGTEIPYRKYNNDFVLQPEGHFRAFYDFSQSRMDVTSFFVGAGPSFVTSGFLPARSSYNVGASITTFGKGCNFIFTFSYDFEWKADYTAQNGFIRARYEW